MSALPFYSIQFVFGTELCFLGYFWVLSRENPLFIRLSALFNLGSSTFVSTKKIDKFRLVGFFIIRSRGFEQANGKGGHIVFCDTAVGFERALQKQIGKLLGVVCRNVFKHVVKIGGRAECARDAVA